MRERWVNSSEHKRVSFRERPRSGAADSLMVLKRQSRTDSDAVLYLSGRDIPERELALTFNNGIWRYAGDPFDLRLTAERRDIVAIMRAGGRPMLPKEIAELLEPKKSAGAVQKALSRMIDDGVVERAAGQAGKYTLPPEGQLQSDPYNYPREWDEPLRGKNQELPLEGVSLSEVSECI